MDFCHTEIKDLKKTLNIKLCVCSIINAVIKQFALESFSLLF